jgi:hypothetical protein
MEINFEVLNFLNMNNERLGKLYKKGKLGFFSKATTIPDELFLSRINLDKLSEEIKYPDFLFKTNLKIKKFFKKSLKNNKKLLKIAFLSEFLNKNNNFEIKFFLMARSAILRKLLREYSGSNFKPFKIYEELFSLNPVFEELMFESYENIDNLDKFLIELPTKYKDLYEQKLEVLNKKQEKQAKKAEQERLVLEQTTKLAKTSKMKETKKTVSKAEKTTKKQPNLIKTTVKEK